MSFPIERRARPRRPANITATVVYDDGRTRVEGKIRNVSEGGARLEMSPQGALPENFYMLMPEHRMQPCTIVWHDDGSFGLIFKSDNED